MKTNANPSEAVLIDSREAARRLGISARTLWGLTNRGEIPCVRINRTVRYRPESLHQYAVRKEGRQ